MTSRSRFQDSLGHLTTHRPWLAYGLASILLARSGHIPRFYGFSGRGVICVCSKLVEAKSWYVITKAFFDWLLHAYWWGINIIHSMYFKTENSSSKKVFDYWKFCRRLEERGHPLALPELIPLTKFLNCFEVEILLLLGPYGSPEL